MINKVIVLFSAFVLGLSAFAVEKSFDWSPGVTNPNGWCTSFGESAGEGWDIIGPQGSIEKVCVVRRDDNGTWVPWTKTLSGVETAKEEYTLCVYASADMVKPASGKFAVLWAMGFWKNNIRTMLIKDAEGNIKLVQTSSNTDFTKTINAGKVTGWHLFTVRFKKNTTDDKYTASLQIDGGTVNEDTTFSLPDKGIQFGSILGGVENNAEVGTGFAIKNVFAFDTVDISEEEYSQIVQTYPAFTSMLMLPNKKGARIFEGMLSVQSDKVYRYPSIEFGDKQGNPSFGMDLEGTMEITANQTFDSNGSSDAYNACNNGNGINFGEWTGNGTINVLGTFSAPNAVAVLCFSSSSSVLNVNGGRFTVKGVTSSHNDRATVNLLNGGLINYGKFPSTNKRIQKNYGNGTVTGTASSDDTDAITLTDASNGTTFLADGITLTYSGVVTGEGKAIVNAINGGSVKFANYNAGPIVVGAGKAEVASGTIGGSGAIEVASGAELYLGVNTQCNIGINLLDGAILSFHESCFTREFVLPKINSMGENVKIIFGATVAPVKNVNGDYMIAFPDEDTSIATECVLRISEIMPKPTDSLNHGLLEGMDPNGNESGWVELENTSDKWADLADYRFIRVNRSKKTDEKGLGNFPSVLIPPKSKFVFWTSERYPNSKDASESMFAQGTFKGTPEIFPEYNNMLVWGDKINPKKFPFVRLYHAPEGGDLTVADTVVIPSDLPEGMSLIVGHAVQGTATQRWICPTPSRGRDNTPVDDLVEAGPNVGPVYEKKGLKKTELASEFERIAPPAEPGKDYQIKLAVNPVMNPQGGFTPRQEDEIVGLKLVYRADLDDATLKTNEIDLTTLDTSNENWGKQYTAVIPAEDFPQAGHLIQWKVLITDASGHEWVSPSFNNKDDGYEWYGTIVEPGELNSATLPTWHMFVDNASKAQMDIDADEQNLPNNARVAIYDSSTSNYYDYVRIDLRGNTSKNFAKKSHGLRFAKAHPLTMKDIVTGETIEEFRKTSLISEFGDPSWMRQMVAFWLFRQMGNKVPFDFPIRCNLNGEFYQLAFHSERFTDELIEDYYGLDKFGYGYKNVGTLKSGTGTTAGGIEKKTPDDGNEDDISVLENQLRKPLKYYGAQNGRLDNAELTKFVVEKFDLSAWINYIASSKITQECDDVWANISIYYDNPEIVGGYRGTGTWMPLGYDFNISFGQWYYNDIQGERFGLMANQDWFKSHPFYGGNTVLCYRQADMTSTVNSGNDAYEAVFQSSKFRRLYLRRLRTLMDQHLKAPGTPESDVPFMVEMRRLANLMRKDSVLDSAKWPNDGTDNAIDVWGDKRPKGIDAGIDDIWQNYVIPRREHLYITHSVENTEWEAGYGSSLNAAIPLAQSPITALRSGITAEFNAELGALIIKNSNDEVIDISGWVLSGPVEMVIPAGTVLDKAIDGTLGEVYVALDRRATVEKLTVVDQVIVGNAISGSGEITLYTAQGERVLPAVVELQVGSEGVLLEATTLEAALAEIDGYVAAPTQEDIAAGMTPEMLMVRVEPVLDGSSQVVGYKAVIALNPDVVSVPAFAEGVEDVLKVDSSESGNQVTLTISNAMRGLWYGYEVTDSLDKQFTNDIPSFKRATENGELSLSSSARTEESGFFRIKVSHIKPQE